MEAINIAYNLNEAYEEYGQDSSLIMEPVTQEEILQPEEEPLGLFKGLIFALPISLLMWGFLIWVFL